MHFAETKRPKRVLVLINPIGGNGTAMVDFRNIVKPVFSLSGISMDIIGIFKAIDFLNCNETYPMSPIF